MKLSQYKIKLKRHNHNNFESECVKAFYVYNRLFGRFWFSHLIEWDEKNKKIISENKNKRKLYIGVFNVFVGDFGFACSIYITIRRRKAKNTRIPSPIPQERRNTPQNTEVQVQETPSTSRRQYAEVLKTPTTSGNDALEETRSRIDALIAQAHAAIRRKGNQIQTSTLSENTPTNTMDIDEVTALINQRVAEAIQANNIEHEATQRGKDTELDRLRIDNDVLQQRLQNPSPNRALTSALSGLGIVAANAIAAERSKFRGGSRRGEPDRFGRGRGQIPRAGYQNYSNNYRGPPTMRGYPTRGRGEYRGADNRGSNTRGNNRGREIPTAFDREMSESDPRTQETILKELEKLPQELRRHIHWVKNNIRKMQKSNKTYYDRKHIPHPFKSGDKVMIRNHARSDKTAYKIQKLLRKWIGPFLLGAKAEDNDVTFEILTIPDFRSVGRRHVNDLRPYVERRTVRRRLITSPNVDSVDNTDETQEVEEQGEPVRTSRRVRERIDYRTLAGYKTNKRTHNPQV
ncbi:unnamed protein product [Orchesella dallaii]|uniref:Uncharacterized protein n=1 Tax=Orchesella dallaii TaxID=48710 RepID=A0ABP1PLL9_9HEXA